MTWSALLVMTADLATRDIVPSTKVPIAEWLTRTGRYRQTVSAATTLLEPSALSETSLSRHRPSVHLVTPAIVERTVARRGVCALLSPPERETLETLVLEKR